MSSAAAGDVTAGDEIRLAGRTVATVEDVSAYATGNPNQRDVFVEASFETHRQQGDRRFGGTPLRRGQSVSLPAGEYDITGELVRVDSGLMTGTADVLIEDTVSAATADRITEGDVATVAGHETAEVANVVTYATENPDRKRIFVGLSLQTLTGGERPQYGSTTVQYGNAITVDTGEYTIDGQIQRVGSLEPRGTETERTVTLGMSEVREDMADAITPGLSERANGDTVATVTAVDVRPAPIIATGVDGSMNVADHPYNREVTITVDLRVRETTSGVQFKGQSVRQGSRIVLDFGSVTVEAIVVSL